jgi:hypothetical protein
MQQTLEKEYGKTNDVRLGQQRIAMLEEAHNV